MASSSRTKTADRQAILKKLLPLLKKQFKITVPKLDRPVMETMLYAVCLEDSTVEQADAAFARFTAMFPDLNEARVSSISELEPAFVDLAGADWRGFRTRAILQYVFDRTYNFEFESLRKKTLDLAAKQLSKIKHLSPFVRAFTLQQVVGAHLLPMDESSRRFLIWMGLGSPEMSEDELAESLKSQVRKAESHQFSFSIRAAAVDPATQAAFDPGVYPPPEEGHDPGTAIDRLTALYKHGLSSLKVAARTADASAAADKPSRSARSAKPVKGAKSGSADQPADTTAAKRPAKETSAPAAKATPPAKAPAAKSASPKANAASVHAKPAAKTKAAPKAASGKAASGKSATAKSAKGKSTSGKSKSSTKK